MNTYQSEHGLVPGVYAAEAWDAGRLAAEALRSGVRDREAMRAMFVATMAFDGIARPYAFDAFGELVDAQPGLYVAAGTRWLPLPA